jgi:hypothetical protein
MQHAFGEEESMQGFGRKARRRETARGIIL